MEANPTGPGTNSIPGNLKIVNAYSRSAPSAPKFSMDPPRPIGPADSDNVELSSIAKSPAAAKARALVAANVQAPVSFQPAAAKPGADAMPLYRHPADANAAATGVALGRTLDVEG